MKDPFAAWTVALTHTGFSGGLPLSGRDWWPLFDPPPTTPGEIEARVSRSSNPAVKNIGQRLPIVEAELVDLESNGVFAMTMFDKQFPGKWHDRLGPRIPPVVFVQGNQEFLKMPGLAIVGSRDADEASLAFATDLARLAVSKHCAVVTGGAIGVDLAAATAAVQAGGSAIVMPADSFADVAARLIRSGADLGQVLLLTASHPNSGFSVGKAMGRNKLVYATAGRAAVAACKAEEGGTWSGAVEALKMDYCPVCVWTGEGAPPGNAALVAEGATGISQPEDAFSLPEPTTRSSLFD